MYFAHQTEKMTSEVNYKGDLRTQCVHINSRSEIETDAPVDNNGNGARFSPTDLVATALASCMLTVMGIRAHSDGISYTDVTASVIKNMGVSPRRITEIQIEISVSDHWSNEEREIMERVASSCPVAKSLCPKLIQKVSFVYS
jgi:uncharacterized OsmC-like protein